MKTFGLFLFLFPVACDDAKVTIEASHIDDPYSDTGADQGGDTAGDAIDNDGDGYSLAEDCDDSDSTVHPGAAETCNDIDDDCDGIVDNLPPDGDPDSLWFLDADGDGYGAGAPDYFPCEAPQDHVQNDADCADDDPEVNPGAPEICDDGKDNDCDGGSGECVLEGIIPADHAAEDIVGWQPLERIGTVAQSAGDVNGDGLDDLLVAVPKSSEYLHEAGAIYLFTSPLDAVQTIEEADGIFLGSDIEEHAGDAIAPLGDVDGDGNSDMAIGIPQESSMGRHSGAVSIVRGPGTGALNLRESSYRYVGEGPGSFTGSAVAYVGDTDGDGLSEIGIGAPGVSDSGVSVGAVYIVQPRSEGTFNLLAEAQSKISGTDPGGLNRMQIAAGGDLNGDGYADIVIGAPHMSSSGMPDQAGGAFVLFGPFSSSERINDRGAVIQGDTLNGFSGRSVAVTGGGDTEDDSMIAVGCYNCDGSAPTSGAVFLFQGIDEGTYRLSDADITIDGEAYQDFAGYSIANAGDVNGDGFSDLLIGAKGNDYGEATTGAAYLLYGPTHTNTALGLADLKIHGINNNDQFGTHVSAAGDLDADGLSEFMVSAPLSDTSHDDVGRISIFYGNARL